MEVLVEDGVEGVGGEEGGDDVLVVVDDIDADLEGEEVEGGLGGVAGLDDEGEGGHGEDEGVEVEVAGEGEEVVEQEEAFGEEVGWGLGGGKGVGGRVVLPDLVE